MKLQPFLQILLNVLKHCKRPFQRIWNWFSRSFMKIGVFWENHPSYIVCSILYYFMSFLMVDGGFWAALNVLLLYIIALTIGFSEIGERFFRLMNHVRPLETKRESEYVLPLFQEVYCQAKDKYPSLDEIEICMIDSMSVNAMALGRRTVAVTKGALNAFSENELKAIIAHEIAHIYYQDTLASLYAVVGNGILTIEILMYRLIVFLLDIVERILSGKRGFVSFIFGLAKFIIEAIIYLLSFFMQIAIAANSRKNEFRADRFAYDIGYDSDMIEALYLLEKISLGITVPSFRKCLQAIRGLHFV